VERGKVKELKSGKYVVESTDRPGVITPPLDVTGHVLFKPDMYAKEEKFKVGDKVYFFLFPDGTGRIICGY
jgi:hypothetical protein